MNLLVINGPNINMLGIRETDIYGNNNYNQLINLIKSLETDTIKIGHFQSNYEGDLVTVIQQSLDIVDGIIINPGAYTHTSVAILDALRSVNIPTVEVHITDTTMREDYRQISYIRDYALMTYQGYGIKGYKMAIEFLTKYLKENNENTNN